MAPASNEWINGYLNAFLEIDGGGRSCQQHNRSSKQVSRYFVEEVVNKFEERDIHRSWAKATVTRSDRVSSTRMENLCWRIWHERRKRNEVKSEQVESRFQREKRHQDAADELFEDLSEGEKLEVAEASRRMSRNASQLQAWSDQERSRHMYIVLISMHGLVRGENMELGKDSDTGGQVKYVVELAKALATMPGVYRVDLLTRQICAPEVDWSYGEPTEMLVPGCTTFGESSGAYIVRLPCGPRDQYLRKELLWPYIEEFVDGALAHIHNMAKVLADQIFDHGGSRSKELIWPQVIHGHYADAGYAAALLSGALNVPMIMTGHSLGRNKLEQLLAHGRHSKEDANAVYKIFRRIEAEEICLDASEIVITSTKQESVEQWGDYYSGYDVRVDRVLKIRAKKGLDCHGRFMPRMVVIPPGMDFSNVTLDPDTALIANEIGAGTNLSATQTDPPIWGEIMRFLHNPHKPMILALARPDPKKNITTLIKAYGESKPLRDLANLTLIMGNRDNIDGMSTGNANVLTTVLKLIDKYDLHGQVSYPKHHKQYEVPAIYQLAAKTKGVFINPALVEPFGLTLIEAAAHGLPMVATSNGGPVDIQQALQNGLLVDPHDDKAIAEALLKLLADRNLWLECQKNGLKNINVYSWPEHCRTYLSRIVSCRSRHPQWSTDGLRDSYNSEPDSQSDSLRDFQDLSIRLSVDGEKLQSTGLEKNNRNVHISVEDIKNYFEKYAHSKRKSVGNEEQLIDASKFMRGAMLRRRKYLFIYAMDNRESYDLLKEVLKAGHNYDGRNNTGTVISTSLTVSEILEDLKAAQISHMEFDAFICSSGSEIYYPSSNDEGGIHKEKQVSKDMDYEKHISFRWDFEGIAKTLARLFNQLHNGQAESIVKEARRCSSRCLSYRIADNLRQELKVDDLREKLRIRGLRCQIISCQSGARIHVVPLFASRWLALRYLFMRWGVDIPNMFVLLAESGDSDSQMLLHGMHKTIVFKSKSEEETPPQPPGTSAESGLFVVATWASSCNEVLATVNSFKKPSSALNDDK